MLAALPRGWCCFREWRTLRWFFALSIPVVGSAFAVWMHGHGFWRAAGLLLLGFAVSTVLFISLCSGMASSNFGTYFRKTEPLRYWADVVLLSVAYITLCCAGYFWR